MKKTWTGPRLVVLTRGRPEEAVLQGCKAVMVAAGPGNFETGCLMSPMCEQCDFSAIS